MSDDHIASTPTAPAVGSSRRRLILMIPLAAFLVSKPDIVIRYAAPVVAACAADPALAALPRREWQLGPRRFLAIGRAVAGEERP